MSLEENKALIRRLVEVVNDGNEEAVDEIAAGEIAQAARAWIGPFRRAFPDFRMEIVDLVAEGEKVTAHFKCSGTHQGDWQGRAATGRRFEGVDEIYIFEVKDGRLQGAVGVEDNLARMRQLEFELQLDKPSPKDDKHEPASQGEQRLASGDLQRPSGSASL